MTLLSDTRAGIISLVKECSLCTKIAVLMIISLYGLSALKDVESYLAIIPALFLPPNFWIWTVITFSFFNNSILLATSDIATAFLIEKLLLPLWGWMEAIKFCALVNGLSALISIILLYIAYIATFNYHILFDIQIHGLVPLLAALTVAGRQMMPDNVLLTFPLGKFRNKHVTFTILIIMIICVILKLIKEITLILFTCGILISWIYLRFYQKHPNGIEKGDLRDTFTFAGFFPNHLEPPVAILSNTIFSILVRLRICKKVDRTYDLCSSTTIALTVTGDPADNERRRQLALRILNERLNKPDSPGPSWPTLTDDHPPAQLSPSHPGIHHSPTNDGPNRILIPSTVPLEGESGPTTTISMSLPVAPMMHQLAGTAAKGPLASEAAVFKLEEGKVKSEDNMRPSAK